MKGQCQDIARLLAQPFGLRKLQVILRRALLGDVQDSHRQILLVHTDVADTEVGKQGFRGM